MRSHESHNMAFPASGGQREVTKNKVKLNIRSLEANKKYSCKTYPCISGLWMTLSNRQEKRIMFFRSLEAAVR
jgi:hypothetical protein